MNATNSSSDVIFFDNFSTILIATVYPTFFIGLCIVASVRYLWGIVSFAKPRVLPIDDIASSVLANQINSNIAEIQIMKPSLRLLADTIPPLDITDQSSTFYRMKIFDMGTDFAMRYVQATNYPYPHFCEYLTYHMLECVCLKADNDIVVAQQAVELYNQAIIGPSEFSHTQVTSFKGKLDILNTKLSQCNYNTLWQ